MHHVRDNVKIKEMTYKATPHLALTGEPLDVIGKYFIELSREISRVHCTLITFLPHFSPSATGQPACMVRSSLSPLRPMLYQKAAAPWRNTSQLKYYFN